MPYAIVERPIRSGMFFVITKATGRKHSENPLTRAKALAQMRALILAEKMKYI